MVKMHKKYWLHLVTPSGKTTRKIEVSDLARAKRLGRQFKAAGAIVELYELKKIGGKPKKQLREIL